MIKKLAVKTRVDAKALIYNFFVLTSKHIRRENEAQKMYPNRFEFSNFHSFTFLYISLFIYFPSLLLPSILSVIISLIFFKFCLKLLNFSLHKVRQSLSVPNTQKLSKQALDFISYFQKANLMELISLMLLSKHLI